MGLNWSGLLNRYGLVVSVVLGMCTVAEASLNRCGLVISVLEFPVVEWWVSGLFGWLFQVQWLVGCIGFWVLWVRWLCEFDGF